MVLQVLLYWYGPINAQEFKLCHMTLHNCVRTGNSHITYIMWYMTLILCTGSSNNQGNKKGTSQDTLIQGMSKIDEEHIILRKTTTTEEVRFDDNTMHANYR